MHRALLYRSAGLALLLLGACKAEPDFDERYSNAEQQIRSKAREIETQLKEGTAESGEAAEPGERGNGAS